MNTPTSEPAPGGRSLAAATVSIHFCHGLLKPQPMPASWPAERAVEDLVRERLNVRPLTVGLFGLRRRKSKTWLAPQQCIGGGTPEDVEAAEDDPLELRLRFKVPFPKKLRDLDQSAFVYFYSQVRADFLDGSVTRNIPKNLGSAILRWWWPQTKIEKEKGGKKRKMKFFGEVSQLSCLIMAVDVLDTNKSTRDVVGAMGSDYMPKNVWTSYFEKRIGLTTLSGTMETRIQNLLQQNKKSSDLKLTFLGHMEKFFPHYYEDHFYATVTTAAPAVNSDGQSESDDGQEVRLLFRPPFKATFHPFDESEPVLAMEKLPNKYEDGRKSPVGRDMDQLIKCCSIDEICHITVDDVSFKHVEIARKNGIPLYLTMRSHKESMSFLSHLCGYYRLCEKWTFNLCSAITYPSLNFQLANSLHGPVTNQFVEEKFQHKGGRDKPGTFLIRQSCDKYDLLYLYYTPKEGARADVLHIIKTTEGRYRLNVIDQRSVSESVAVSGDYESLKDLVKRLRGPDSPIALRQCLHPSEYDKAATLLLCRSINKLKSDLINDSNRRNEEPKVVIPFQHLSKIEHQRIEGKFTTVWHGFWLKKGWKQDVAIKQLKSKHQVAKLQDFMHLACTTMMWDEATLVKVLGTTLCMYNNPMVMVTEYFYLGPLDCYLTNNKPQMQEVDLVEACASIARALWYLQENGFQHGNIRCRNVFVAEHTSSCFKVKLGDPGLERAYGPDHLHWLPLELLLLDAPKKDQCTIKGDVYAMATTFWQVFSYGIVPSIGHVDPAVVRQSYIEGNRLSRPQALKEETHLGEIYRVMLSCWDPDPELRMEPQAIMRDLTQMLNNVLNRGKRHAYQTIDDPTGQVNGANGQAPLEADPAALGVRGSFREGQSYGDAVVASLDESNYVNQAAGLPSSPAASSLAPNYCNGGQEAGGVAVAAAAYANGQVGAESGDSNSVNYGKLTTHNLVPTFNDMMRNFFDQAAASGHNETFRSRLHPVAAAVAASNSHCPRRSDSCDLLLQGSGGSGANFGLPSRPGSSMDGSLMKTNVSQFTSQTSLSSFSNFYSMNSFYYLDKEQLELNRDKLLGEGNFGVVYRGVMSRSPDDWDPVAVKMLKETADTTDEAVAEMRRELEIMKSLNHENVVKIKGVLRDDRKVLIIMEYVPEGSLEVYLQRQRKDQVQFKQLFLFARNIVDGMEYLGQKGIIHRDLAARNILVANDELVKISDFGLARAVEKDFYVQKSSNHVPVRWLAVECLTHNRYSFASDVWSFGVTLWEMFSFGATPYLHGCKDFFQTGTDEQQREDMRRWMQLLEKGTRLPQPECCPNAVYKDVMKACWERDATARPSFVELGQRLNRIELQVT